MEFGQSKKEKSLAWFKLADLIARREREKALNVFRLLAHSIPDRAYVLQIEGDILWYLDDKNAAEKYKAAAFLYQKEKRWIDAIAVYEHLLTQNSESTEVLASLVLFYAMVDWQDKFQERFDLLMGLVSKGFCDEHELERVIREVAGLADTDSKQWVGQWSQQVIQGLSPDLRSRLHL